MQAACDLQFATDRWGAEMAAAAWVLGRLLSLRPRLTAAAVALVSALWTDLAVGCLHRSLHDRETICARAAL